MLLFTTFMAVINIVVRDIDCVNIIKDPVREFNRILSINYFSRNSMPFSAAGIQNDQL